MDNLTSSSYVHSRESVKTVEIVSTVPFGNIYKPLCRLMHYADVADISKGNPRQKNVYALKVAKNVLTNLKKKGISGHGFSLENTRGKKSFCCSRKVLLLKKKYYCL